MESIKNEEILYVTRYEKMGWNDQLKWFPSIPEQAAYVLSQIFIMNNEKFFALLDLDKRKLNLEKKPDYTGLDKRYRLILDSYYVWQLLKKEGKEAWLTEEFIKKYFPDGVIANTTAEPLDYEGVTFIARFGDWFSAKKLSIDERTELPEILQTLSSINASVMQKSFFFIYESNKLTASEKLSTYDKITASLTKGKRRGFTNLHKIICDADDIDEMMRPFVLHKVLSKLKMLPYVDILTFNKVFPEYKIRMPKRRKKVR